MSGYATPSATTHFDDSGETPGRPTTEEVGHDDDEDSHSDADDRQGSTTGFNGGDEIGLNVTESRLDVGAGHPTHRTRSRR
jgi:hypothetical protein